MSLEASRTAGTDLDTLLTTFTADHDEEKIEMEGEGYVPEHQPEDEEYDCEEPFVPTEAEKDAEARAAAQELALVAHRRGAPAAAKRPRSPPLPDIDDDVPDLAEIFDNYDTPKATRISICRAYASYLASTLPKKPKAAPKKRSK